MQRRCAAWQAYLLLPRPNQSRRWPCETRFVASAQVKEQRPILSNLDRVSMIKTRGSCLALAERTLILHEKSSEHCICFPAKEPPFFSSVADQGIGASPEVSFAWRPIQTTISPLHTPWRKERAPIRRKSSSPQFKKAWLASRLEL
jgi:hypothetical protein